MLSPDFHRAIAAKAKVLNIIWGAMLAASLFYVVLAWIMSGQTGGGEAQESGPMMMTIISVVALGALGASIWAERRMLAPSRLAQYVEQVPAAGVLIAGLNGAVTATPEQIQQFATLSDTEKRLAGLSVPYQMAMIVVWSLRESVVVLGLVLSVMQTSFAAILPFALIGVAALVQKAPRSAAFYERQLELVRRFG